MIPFTPSGPSTSRPAPGLILFTAPADLSEFMLTSHSLLIPSISLPHPTKYALKYVNKVEFERTFQPSSHQAGPIRSHPMYISSPLTLFTALPSLAELTLTSHPSPHLVRYTMSPCMTSQLLTGAVFDGLTWGLQVVDITIDILKLKEKTEENEGLEVTVHLYVAHFNIWPNNLSDPSVHILN